MFALAASALRLWMRPQRILFLLARRGVPAQLDHLKKTVLTTLQVVITLTILFFVFRDPDKRAEIWAALQGASHGWLLVGFAVYGCVEVLAGIRWQVLLRVQGIYLSWFRVTGLLLIGVFFNFFIPGGTGGDVVKIFYLMKETPGRRTQALLSVLVDRIIGLVALAMFAGIFCLLRWNWLTSNPHTEHCVWATLIILGSSLGGLHFSYIITRYNLVHKLPAWMPGRDKFAELALAYNLYGRAWRTSLLALLISVAAHMGYFATFACAAESYRASGARVPSAFELFAIMPVVNTITAMPISIGGIGVREGLFQLFLGKLAGVTEAVALAISSTGYLLTLAWGLIGGIVYMVYRPSEHARLRDMRAEVAAFEHTVAEEEIALEATAGPREK